MKLPKHKLTEAEWKAKLQEEWEQIGQGSLDLQLFYEMFGAPGTDEMTPKEAIYEDFASA